MSEKKNTRSMFEEIRPVWLGPPLGLSSSRGRLDRLPVRGLCDSSFPSCLMGNRHPCDADVGGSENYHLNSSTLLELCR